MSMPTALLVSCSPKVDAIDVVKDITQSEDLTTFSPIAEDVEGYPWQVSNKYYTADVLLCVAPPCVMGSLTLGESMEGIVIVLDDEKKSFKEAQSQWSTVKEMNPEVRILACKQFTKSPGVPKQDMLEWCLDNAFELVELEKPEDEDEEEEDGFGVEPYGVKRIVAALHAHTWSNLEMKEDTGSNLLRLQERFREDEDSVENETCNGRVTRDSENEGDSIHTEQSRTNHDCSDSVSKTSPATAVENRTESASGGRTDIECAEGNSVDRSSDGCHGNSGSVQSSGATSGLSHETTTSGGTDGSKSDQEKTQTTAKPDSIDAMMNQDAKLFEALGNEDPGGESFEQLFSRLAYMKEKANALEGEDRRKYAEKVAVAFWRAVGGDEDEIGGLGDDSD